MDFLRSRASKFVKRALASRERVLQSSSRFGLDPFADVVRLAGVWKYPIETIFDVGANDGDTAIALLDAFPKARVLSFEPHPSTYARLIARLGNRPHFEGFNLGMGTEVGDVEMIEYDESKTNSFTPDAQYAKRFGTEGRSIRVRVSVGEIFCEERGIDRIDLLKIDTEGFDLVVLRGFAGMLERRAVRFVMVEFNDLLPKEGVFGGALLPFEELMRPFGYRFVAAYNDYISTRGEMFGVSNALFCLPGAADFA